MDTNQLFSFHNFLLLFQGILVVIISVIVARMKGRHPFFWGLLSFAFGIYALFLLALLPQVKSEETALSDPKGPPLVPPNQADLNLKQDKQEAAPEPSLPPPPPAPLMLAQLSTAEWYFCDEKKEVEGPFRLSKIQELADQGKLTKNSYVWCELFPEWKKIASDEQLLHSFFGTA